MCHEWMESEKCSKSCSQRVSIAMQLALFLWYWYHRHRGTASLCFSSTMLLSISQHWHPNGCLALWSFTKEDSFSVNQIWWHYHSSQFRLFSLAPTYCCCPQLWLTSLLFELRILAFKTIYTWRDVLQRRELVLCLLSRIWSLWNAHVSPRL